MKTITINGKMQPLHFGKSYFIKLEIATGISMNNISEEIKNKPVFTLCNMLYYSLKEGAKKENKEFEMTIDDIADAWDNDDSLMDKFMEIINTVFNTKDEKKLKPRGKK